MAVYNPNSVSSTLGIAPLCGLPSSRFVPASLQSQAGVVAAASVPPSAPSDFVPYCTACLIARGIIYFKNTPGDCGVPTPINLQNAQFAGEAGTAALGIASMAGAVLPGIGAAISAIQSIFANHAQAVATEQATICQVAGVINQVFAYYDTQVALGNISPSTAYAGMQNFLNLANEQLQTIEKTCNAACVYQGILKAHSTFVQYYYPAIAPIQAEPAAPGAPPVSTGQNPGGVMQVGGSGAVNTVQPQTNVSPAPVPVAQPSSVAPVTFNISDERRVVSPVSPRIPPYTIASSVGGGIGASTPAGTQVAANAQVVPGLSANNLVLIGLVALAVILIAMSLKGASA